MSEKGDSIETVGPQKEQVKALENLYNEEAIVDDAYQAKARVINQAIQDIGMGRYQWYLFTVAGFGWFADSCWPLLGGLILSPVLNEFDFKPPYLPLASNIGLLVGALWGMGSDAWGRKWIFNTTLFIAGVFGVAAGGAQNFMTLAAILALNGVAVGGNLPIDSAVFLDFVPSSHQYLLAVLDIWWGLGTIVSNLVAWALITNFSCPFESTACDRADNMGWRYLLFTLGSITLALWGIRFVCLPILESPRFLAGVGRDTEAVGVIQRIAKMNGVQCTLTVAQLVGDQNNNKEGKKEELSRASASMLSPAHVKALFSTPKMALSTSLLMAIWCTVSLGTTLYGNFLPYLFTQRGIAFGDGSINITYRNQVITSIFGPPGALVTSYFIERPAIGRKGTLVVTASVAGVTLFGMTTARSSNAFLAWNCVIFFFINAMYAVLCTVGPELFPAKDRGTGNTLMSTSRIFNVLAPVVALCTDLTTAVPVYIAGGLLVFAGLLAMLLPYETRGKASI